MNSQNDSEIFLSILIPTWNRTKTVESLLRSIELPTGLPAEIVVVDNASDEGVYKELQEICARFPQVVLSRNASNIGMTRNWNRCLELARGKWVGLMCSDDLYNPGAVSRAVELMKSLEGPHLIIQDPLISSETEHAPAGPETSRNLRLPLASGNFWSREIFLKLGGYHEKLKYSPDGEYWGRIAHWYPVVKVKTPFAIYNSHTENFAYTTWLKDDFLDDSRLLIELNYKNQALQLTDDERNRSLRDSEKALVRYIITAAPFTLQGLKILVKYLKVGLGYEQTGAEKARYFAWATPWLIRFLGRSIKPLVRRLRNRSDR